MSQQPHEQPDDEYVAWCRYTNTTIVTCDSNSDNAFRVYRHADDPDSVIKFYQMADCLDDIRVIVDDVKFASRMNCIKAIRNRINFDLPDTPGSLRERQRLTDASDELTRLRRSLDNLLEQIEIDGSLIHSDACDCDVCLAIRAAQAALKGDV